MDTTLQWKDPKVELPKVNDIVFVKHTKAREFSPYNEPPYDVCKYKGKDSTYRCEWFGEGDIYSTNEIKLWSYIEDPEKETK